MMKGRLMGAQKGHSLLKKKADALQMRFRLILSKIIQVKLFIVVLLPSFHIGSVGNLHLSSPLLLMANYIFIYIF